MAEEAPAVVPLPAEPEAAKPVDDEDTPIATHKRKASEQLEKEASPAPAAPAAAAPTPASAQSTPPAPAAEQKTAEDDDAVPLKSLVAAPAPDSDDELPLKTLLAKPKKKEKDSKDSGSSSKSKSKDKENPESKSKKSSKEKKEKDEPPKKKAKRAKKEDSDEDEVEGRNVGGGGKIVTDSSILYDDTEKGNLVKKLLCRWWYAMEWPSKEDLEKEPPPNYDALDGFPGLYVCVKGDESIGKLLDMRDQATCPSFKNFSEKSSQELTDLLRIALTKQREALREHWGAPADKNLASTDAPGKKQKVKLRGPAQEEDDLISRELKWVEKVDCAAADKEAARKMRHR